MSWGGGGDIEGEMGGERGRSGRTYGEGRRGRGGNGGGGADGEPPLKSRSFVCYAELVFSCTDGSGN